MTVQQLKPIEIRHEALRIAGEKVYRDEVIEDLKTRTGGQGAETFKQVSLPQYALGLPRGTGPALPPSTRIPGSRGTVAVVYAEGAIVDGQGSLTEVGGARFARELRRLRQDDAAGIHGRPLQGGGHPALHQRSG